MQITLQVLVTYLKLAQQPLYVSVEDLWTKIPAMCILLDIRIYTYTYIYIYTYVFTCMILHKCMGKLALCTAVSQKHTEIQRQNTHTAWVYSECIVLVSKSVFIPF